MSSTEVFREVRRDELPKVMQVLERDWPKHFVLHQLQTVMADYIKGGTTWKHTLCLCGDYETGVYLNLVHEQNAKRQMTYVYVYSPVQDVSAAERALCHTQLVPWQTNTFFFAMIHSTFRSAVVAALKTHNKDFILHENTMFWFPPDKELKLQLLPDDTFIEFLNGSYAEEMDRTWPHREPGSDLTQREHLERNFGLGLFRKSDRRMLSSSLSNHTGGIFVLHTDPEFRGKGYAGFILQHMVQEIRRRGRIPFATVIIGNKPSELLFSKTGFLTFTMADYFLLKDNA